MKGKGVNKIFKGTGSRAYRQVKPLWTVELLYQKKFSLDCPQVAQARYMSSSMWTFALLRDSSDLHIYKDLYGERNKPEKKRKITVELQ